jgi:predicted RNA-binding Zn ribbon-like protein
MIDPNILDSASIEDLVNLKELVDKKVAERFASERADIDKRQASLAKLTERIEKGPAKPREGRRATTTRKQDNAPKAAGEGGETKGEAAPAGSDGQHAEAATA